MYEQDTNTARVVGLCENPLQEYTEVLAGDMQTKLVQDLLVVIRSANERTEATCYNLLSQQIPTENIVLIHERPFSLALAKSYQLGIEHGLPWTLCIDADVLVTDEAVNYVLHAVKSTPGDWFAIQCRVLDKFFGGEAHAGNTLYRTSLLESALDLIPEDKISLRPETLVLRTMAKKGYPWKTMGGVIGLHGYEQYYRDIYRTMFVRARKHRPYADILLRHWRNFEGSDDDFKVAPLGLRDGLLCEGTISLDVDAFPNQKVKSLLSTYGLSEKAALDFSNISRLVRRTIDTYRPSVEFGDLQERITKIDKRLTAIEKRKTALSSMRGLPYWALIALSRLLIRAGKKIQHELGS